MLGGKLFDSKGKGPYTPQNLDGLRDGSKKLIKDFFKGITFDCIAFCSNKAVSTSSNK